MKSFGTSQVHLIPFDLGFVFYDVLNIDNSKNLIFGNEFVEELIETYKNKNPEVSIKNNIIFKHDEYNIKRVSFINSDLCDDAIAIFKLRFNLYCYILMSGVGMFVYIDNGLEAIPASIKPLTEPLHHAVVANYQKKITRLMMLKKFKCEESIFNIEKLMMEFRTCCWGIINDLVKQKKQKLLREFSSDVNYKSQGLSYVLTIYLLAQERYTSNEINHLLYSPIFNNITDVSHWQAINKKISKQYNGDVCCVKAADLEIHFSWSGVGVVSKQSFDKIEDIFNDKCVCDLLKAEIYVQSKWFIADNSLDNIKGQDNTLENMQRLLSLIDYSQAELENEVSANMSEFYKSILDKIISTSEVRKLYKSVSSQISSQMRIKEAIYEDKKDKNILIMNVFMALFTAASLFKAILEIIERDFSLRNIVLFLGSLIIAVTAVMFNHYYK